MHNTAHFNHIGRKALVNIESLDDFSAVKALFEYQVQNNQVFREFVKNLRRPFEPQSWQDLTFLPIEAFKRYEIQSGNWTPEMTFLSSGTTGQPRSRHLIRDIEAYLSHTLRNFELLIGISKPARHLAFMPFYRKNPSSSLLKMMEHFIESSGHNGSAFVSTESELDTLLEMPSDGPTIVWTVTFGLMDYIEKSALNNITDVLFIETGGMKGRRQPLTRQEMHERFSHRWPDAKISSEYGMCELQSQAYWKGNAFQTPPGMFCLGTSIDDPLMLRRKGRRVQLNIIDMANVDTCAFIATEDFGQVDNERSFTVEGRLSNADLRGCNLMYED